MQDSKIYRMLAVALTLAWLAATLPATPALAVENLKVYPTSGKVSEQIEAFGSGFGASTQYELFFSDEVAFIGGEIDTNVSNYEFLGVKNTDFAGSFQFFYFFVPRRLTDGKVLKTVLGGTHYLYATQRYSKSIVARVSFTVTAVASITLEPKAGTVGTEVTLSGEGFGNSENITAKYDGVAVAITGNGNTNSDGQFGTTTIITPPSAAGEHTITVTGAKSATAAEAKFTVEPKIIISPESGAAGDNISVEGSGFGSSLSYSILFADATVVTNKTAANGSFKVTFIALSRGAGSYNVEAVDGNANSDRVGFTLAPAAISLSATSGNVGDEVSISGVGFRAMKPISVIYDNDLIKTVSSDGYGKFTAVFRLPARNAGTYTVRVSDGINTRETDFAITTSASITPVTSSTSPGYVGTEVTISGIGFIAGRTVTISYDGNQISTTTIKPDGNFSASFKAPAGSGGDHSISATDGSTTKSFTFVMESAPPATPLPLKPEMSIKAEAETYFDWAEVTDPSGVSYTLEIATSADFAAGSLVLEKTGLTQSQYTLTKGERLKSVSQETPYYWHVKATDGAANASQWSGNGAFYVGFGFTMEFPYLRYIIIGVAALLLGLLGFWLGRRSAYY